ncbi:MULTISPECIES: hypothetical protein [unclassified Mesorhizobium]|uniref:hypothetical protein n=1 Tax=unclassified Mesorhizobium TaxID=325217 RepID=UPI000BAEA1D3|nr:MULTISPECIES: hypothetical protein [unclassified Mesorhizobium]PBC24864.1 hypothetical protein CK226_03205 [Mesorhizobium sp. WSM4311]TRD02890.1 hypothetical protein FJV82_16660 [Mesorhizobium sp. WSM4305]
MAGRSSLPQILPPGLPPSEEPFAGDYEIVWSIYVRCNNLQKLRGTHIPALEALIGQPHGGKGWVIDSESYNENRDRSLKRIVAAKRLQGPYTEQFLLDFMKTLYLLAPSWNIQARLSPSHPHGVYVCAHFSRETTTSEAPAVVDALVELTAAFTGDGQSGTYIGSGQRIS